MVANKLKYTEEYGSLASEHFDALIEMLQNFSDEFFELINEVDSHKEVTLLRLKTLIEDRTNLLIANGEVHTEEGEPTVVRNEVEFSTE